MKNPVAELLKLRAAGPPVPLTATRPPLSGWLNRGPDKRRLLATYGGTSTVYAVVRTLAESTSMVRWHLYADASSGLEEDRKEIGRHPALSVWRQPNGFMTTRFFVQICQTWVDLVGEAPIVLATSPLAPDGPPVEMWPVRPDRLRPVPDPEEFISGFVYITPDGGLIPLTKEQVIWDLRYPNPDDLYCGLGPVQALLGRIDSLRYSTEWNRKFFENDAAPGGLIEFEEGLTDPQFNQVVRRWREQHQGVHNAHRVAIIERGKWRDRTFSMRDMQFVELDKVSREVIQEAYGVSKSVLGVVEDVNRANAEASEAQFSRKRIKPRLEMWREVLDRLVRVYGDASRWGMVWDYDDPTPEDEETAAKVLALRADAAAKLQQAGWDPDEVLQAVGLPEIGYGAAPELVPVSQNGNGALPPEELAAVVSDMVKGFAR